MSRVPSKQRREQLVEAAIDLSVEEGLPAASIRRIADRANVSLGVVHYHFRSKEELLSAMAGSFLEPLLGALAVVTEGAGNSPAADSRSAALEAFWDAVKQDPGRQLLGYELIPWSVRGTGEAAQVLVDSQTDVVARVLANTGHGAADTDELPPRTLARLILAACEGVTLSWLADRDDVLARDSLELLIRAILAGSEQSTRLPDQSLEETVA